MAALAEILELREDKGVAGQLMYTVRVRYSSGDMTVGFVGGIYGRPGPVILLHGNTQTVVAEPERFGERFNEQWVRKFYGTVIPLNQPDQQGLLCPRCDHALYVHSVIAGCGLCGCTY